MGGEKSKRPELSHRAEQDEGVWREVEPLAVAHDRADRFRVRWLDDASVAPIVELPQKLVSRKAFTSIGDMQTGSDELRFAPNGCRPQARLRELAHRLTEG